MLLSLGETKFIMRKQGYSSEKYKKELLSVLREELLLSTSELCKAKNMGYETALKYLEALKAEGLIEVKIVGDQKFWYIRNPFSSEKGIFLVNALGIVYRRGKILVGRRVFDPYVEKLTWQFPGGRVDASKGIERSLKEEIRKKTGLFVKVGGLIQVRIPKKERSDLLSIYYLCTPVRGKEKAGEKFVELRWIRPTDIRKLFTTSYDSEVFRFLQRLEKYTKLHI